MKIWIVFTINLFMTCRRRAFPLLVPSFAKSCITKWEKFAALMKKLAAGGFLLLSAPFINNPAFIREQHMVPIMNPKSLRRLRPLDNDVFGFFLSAHTASWEKRIGKVKKVFSLRRNVNRKRCVFVFFNNFNDASAFVSRSKYGLSAEQQNNLNSYGDSLPNMKNSFQSEVE